VQAEVDVMTVDGRVVQALDEGDDHHRLDASHDVDPAQGRQVEVCEAGHVATGQPDGAGHRRLGTQLGRSSEHRLGRVGAGSGYHVSRMWPSRPSVATPTPQAPPGGGG